jgi:hypothetical protein
MLTKWFLLPLFLHVLLTLVVGARSLRARIDAVRKGRVKLAEIANNNSAWPDDARKLGNNFNNQFESPTLWYAVCALVVALRMEDLFLVVMSWLFLGARLGHSFIHTGSNNVRMRLSLFLCGFTVIVVMWAWFMFKLFHFA